MAKNKIKTHKATAKRFKVSGSGKVRHQKQGNNDHLKIKKSSSRKARLRGSDSLSNKTEKTKVLRLINN